MMNKPIATLKWYGPIYSTAELKLLKDVFLKDDQSMTATEPTSSDPLRQFDEKEKEKDVAKLMNKIANSKRYTISEYRDIEMHVRRLAGLPRRDYHQQAYEEIARQWKEDGPNRKGPEQDAAPNVHREVNPEGD